MTKTLKTKLQMYEDVREFIQNHADKKTLINMLVEMIDNFDDDYSMVKDLNINYANIIDYCLNKK